MGVMANFGTKVDRGKGAVRLDPDVMEDVGVEQSDKGDGVVVKIDDTRKETEEVVLNKFFLWDPKLLTLVVDNLVLVQVMVDGKGTGGGMEEIGEKVSYRLLK